MNKHERQIAALITAWKKQTDQVKKAKIADKIFQIKQKKIMADWLSN